jgi:hypothetical protein
MGFINQQAKLGHQLAGNRVAPNTPNTFGGEIG